MGVLMHMKDFKDDKGKRTMRSTSMESKEEGHVSPMQTEVKRSS